MDLGMRGKRALVLGGSDGLGLAVAKCLFAEGADVVLASRNPDKLERARLLLQGPGKAEVQQVDALSEASLRAAAKAVGHVDILVNNSGGPAAGDPLAVSLEDWDRGYQSLVRSVILMTQLLVPGMASRKWGRILNITSTSAREIIPRLPVSSTFRSGLTGLTKELAKALGRKGILVNNLLPGPTNTERLKDLEKKSPEFYRTMAEKSALGRIAEPEEIGRVAAFLCSNANTFVTGTDVLVDGGFTSAL